MDMTSPASGDKILRSRYYVHGGHLIDFLAFRPSRGSVLGR